MFQYELQCCVNVSPIRKRGKSASSSCHQESTGERRRNPGLSNGSLTDTQMAQGPLPLCPRVTDIIQPITLSPFCCHTNWLPRSAEKVPVNNCQRRCMSEICFLGSSVEQCWLAGPSSELFIPSSSDCWGKQLELL